MKKQVDYSVYLVTDRNLSKPRQVIEVVRLAVNGGATIVQLREKELTTREFVELARGVKEILVPLGVPLVINDRVDVALACGADGVHVGQFDMPCAVVRDLMGPDAIVGVSIENMQQAIEAEKSDADYLGVSPIFQTPTKTDISTTWGIDGLRLLRLKTSRTLVAIGGINLSNAAQVIGAGADGLAIVSAICAASDPGAASATFRKIVTVARREMRDLKNETIVDR